MIKGILVRAGLNSREHVKANLALEGGKASSGEVSLDDEAHDDATTERESSNSAGCSRSQITRLPWEDTLFKCRSIVHMKCTSMWSPRNDVLVAFQAGIIEHSVEDKRKSF